MYDDLLDLFDECGLDPRNTVVRCETVCEAEIFLKYLVAKGVRSPETVYPLLSRWKEEGSSTCYHLSRESWCRQSWYEANMPGVCIVSFSDIYKPVQHVDAATLKFSFDELMQGVL